MCQNVSVPGGSQAAVRPAFHPLEDNKKTLSRVLSTPRNATNNLLTGLFLNSILLEVNSFKS